MVLQSEAVERAARSDGLRLHAEALALGSEIQYVFLQRIHTLLNDSEL